MNLDIFSRNLMSSNFPANELTISIFRESYPREMFEAMKDWGLEINEHYPQ